jgi:hypothetical protein
LIRQPNIILDRKFLTQITGDRDARDERDRERERERERERD